VFRLQLAWILTLFPSWPILQNLKSLHDQSNERKPKQAYRNSNPEKWKERRTDWVDSLISVSSLGLETRCNSALLLMFHSMNGDLHFSWDDSHIRIILWMTQRAHRLMRTLVHSVRVLLTICWPINPLSASSGLSQSMLREPCKAEPGVSRRQHYPTESKMKAMRHASQYSFQRLYFDLPKSLGCQPFISRVCNFSFLRPLHLYISNPGGLRSMILLHVMYTFCHFQTQITFSRPLSKSIFRCSA